MGEFWGLIHLFAYTQKNVQTRFFENSSDLICQHRLYVQFFCFVRFHAILEQLFDPADLTITPTSTVEDEASTYSKGNMFPFPIKGTHFHEISSSIKLSLAAVIHSFPV